MSQVWMFPGQGTQAPGMAHRLIREYPLAKEIIDLASELCNEDLDYLRQRGPAVALAKPDVAEPLLAAVQISYASLLMDNGIKPRVVAGYSAGEVAAYYAAGILSQHDALRAAVIRGTILKKYLTDEHRMISVTNVSIERVIGKIEADYPAVEIAGWNSHDHATLVGRRDAVQSCALQLRAMGAMIADVDVAGPWHSRGLSFAAKEILLGLNELTFHSPCCEIYLSATGEKEHQPLALQFALADQVAIPVRWQWSMEELWVRGFRNFLEVGSGRVLVGMLRRNWNEVSEFHAECVETSNGGIGPLKRLLSTSTSWR